MSRLPFTRWDSGTDRAVEEAVQALREEQHLPGIALAVVQGGSPVKVAAYGYASLELEAPVTPDTAFCIGSLTKQFTATAILQLCAAGKLALDDSIAPFAEAVLEEPVPEEWRPITLRHLLSHTSGLKRDAVMFRSTENSLPPDYIPVLYEWARQEFTSRALVRALADLPLDFAPPGLKMSYSNAGYYLLGVAIEQASGLSYANYLARHITGPLGMTTTRLVEEEVIPNFATGYTWTSLGWRRGGYVNPSRDHAAGSLVSTLGDLIRWDAAWKGETLLPTAAREEMWTAARLNDGTPLAYGLGWGVTSEARAGGEGTPRRIVAHGGMWGGFTAHWIRLIDDDLTVIALTNLGISGRFPDGGVSGKPGLITRRVASLLLPDLPPDAPG